MPLASPPSVFVVRAEAKGRHWVYWLTDLRTGERRRVVGWRALRQALHSSPHGLR